MDSIISSIMPDYDTTIIEKQRETINSLIASDNPPKIYGFNSLLGHMDHLGISAGDERSMLNAHLVGHIVDMPAEWLRLLALVKSRQLHNGGNGISVEAAKKLRELASQDSRDYEIQSFWGNWFGSYGAGDVVPGAWFVNALEREIGNMLCKRGDLIALINGNFASVSAAIVSLASLKRNRVFLHDAFRTTLLHAHSKNPDIQLPVTVRDIRQVETLLDDSIADLESVIFAELSKSSGNPIFQFVDDNVEILSNSSFLGLQLRVALIKALHVVSFTHAYLLGCARVLANIVDNGYTLAVQSPKIISTNGKQIENIVVSAGAGYALTESHGVEDVGDLSLDGAKKLVTALHIQEQSISIFEKLVNTSDELELDVDKQAREESLQNPAGIDFVALADAISRTP